MSNQICGSYNLLISLSKLMMPFYISDVKALNDVIFNKMSVAALLKKFYRIDDQS